MEKGPKKLDELFREFETDVRGIAHERYPVRSERQLKTASERAWTLAETVAGYKEDARVKQDGAAANMLLSAQCFASALASEIDMWLALREGNPDAAWSKLIDAEEYMDVAARAHATDGTSEMAARLAQLEEMLFPAVVYLSCSFRYRSGTCTICDQKFDECPHEEDGVYVGRLCREVNRLDMRLLEVSVVDSPRDKRCRLATREDGEGVHRNWFTGEIVEGESKGDTEGKMFNALIYSEHRLKNV
jgi:hypothetical protein